MLGILVFAPKVIPVFDRLLPDVRCCFHFPNAKRREPNHVPSPKRGWSKIPVELTTYSETPNTAGSFVQAKYCRFICSSQILSFHWVMPNTAVSFGHAKYCCFIWSSQILLFYLVKQNTAVLFGQAKYCRFIGQARHCSFIGQTVMLDWVKL